MKKISLTTSLVNQDNELSRMSVDLNKSQLMKLNALMKKFNYKSKKKIVIDLIEKQYEVEFS